MKIAFCGKMAAGKDTFGEEFSKYAISKKLNPIHLSFGFALKEEIRKLVKAVSENKTPEEIQNTFRVDKNESEYVVNLIKENLKKDSEIYNHRTPELRHILQYWGTNVRREKDPDYWVKEIEKQLKEVDMENNAVYITDCRFLNESVFLRRNGFLVVYLEVSEKNQKKRILKRDNIKVTKSTLSHPSETEIEKIKKIKNYDFLLDTNSFKEDEIQKHIQKIFK